MPRFPPGLPLLPADAPHLIPAAERERLAQGAVGGRNGVTREDDLRQARWTVDAIDAAFARAKITETHRLHAEQRAAWAALRAAAE